MTFQATASSASPTNPVNLLTTRAGAAALASICDALLAQEPSNVIKALDLFRNAENCSAAIPEFFGDVRITDHPQSGQLQLDSCSPIPTFMPRSVDLGYVASFELVKTDGGIRVSRLSSGRRPASASMPLRKGGAQAMLATAGQAALANVVGKLDITPSILTKSSA